MNMDAVIASSMTDNEDAVGTFLQYAGSADGQRRFNQKKGSIPPRTDGSRGEFNAFLQGQHKAFQSSRSQPLSITHGLGVRPDQLIELKTAMSSFVAEWDIDAATAEVVSAFEQ